MTPLRHTRGQAVTRPAQGFKASADRERADSLWGEH